jgi:hypothetical protein
MQPAFAPESQEVPHDESLGHCPLVGRCLTCADLHPSEFSSIIAA